MFHSMRRATKPKLARLLASMLAGSMVIGSPFSAALADKGHNQEHGGTTTPIKHVIIIVGENHTFDNVFGGYKPANHDSSVLNLLSENIIRADGTVGSNVGAALQNKASDTTTYMLNPGGKSAYSTLPQPNTTYADGRPLNVPDSRFPANLPNAPFQLSKYTAYQLQFTGDPVHRFFQMWQQTDEGAHDLFVWVAGTIGTGSNGNPPPSPFTDQSTDQGGLAMGFENMSTGDAPVFKYIADHYAISDNYHQAVMGGTGANFIFLGTGTAAFYSDGNGTPLTPPSNQIENPDPLPTTNNWYTQDGYSGGSYVDCKDTPYQPGVAQIRSYLNTNGVSPNCEPGHYYLVNNYGPAYNADGSLVDTTAHPFTIPPQTLPNIAEKMSNNGVSWKYYIGGYNGGKATDAWCSICNPFQFIKNTVTNPNLHKNFADVSDFYKDLKNGNLPAVSFIRPYEGYAGHPADSTLSSYEDFVASIANNVIGDEDLFDETAIFVTFDEGGGYYDSGYIQPLDFFGDGTRIPLMVISPWVDPNTIDHTYADHVSLLKFIEANWGLGTLSARSRDNLNNPTSSGNPYVPGNVPAVGDLMTVFNFHHHHSDTPFIIAPGI